MRQKVKVLGAVIVAMALVFPCLAQQTQTYQVSATIESLESLDVVITGIDSETDTWDSAPSSSVDFGTLTYDSSNGVFLAQKYYAVDIGINTNAASWTIEHQAGTITDGAGHNLDSNINVVFVKCEYTGPNTPPSETELGKYVYSSSNRSFTRSSISPGWLRIYYGIATGDPNNDATGAEPITMSKPGGTYTGTVTITLTTS